MESIPTDESDSDESETEDEDLEQSWGVATYFPRYYCAAVLIYLAFVSICFWVLPSSYALPCDIIAGGILLIALPLIGCLLNRLIACAVESAIEQFDRSYLGADIEIDQIHSHIARGMVEIVGFTLKNPIEKADDNKLYSDEPLLHADKLFVDISLWTLFKTCTNTIQIEKLVIANVIMNYEKSIFSGKPSIVQALLNHLRGGGAARDEEKQEAEESDSGDDTSKKGGRKFILHRVRVKNVSAHFQANVIGDHGVGTHIDLADISYKNFDQQLARADNSVLEVVSLLIQSILKSLMSNIVSAERAQGWISNWF